MRFRAYSARSCSLFVCFIDTLVGPEPQLAAAGFDNLSGGNVGDVAGDEHVFNANASRLAVPRAATLLHPPAPRARASVAADVAADLAQMLCQSCRFAIRPK